MPQAVPRHARIPHLELRAQGYVWRRRLTRSVLRLGRESETPGTPVFSSIRANSGSSARDLHDGSGRSGLIQKLQAENSPSRTHFAEIPICLSLKTHGFSVAAELARRLSTLSDQIFLYAASSMCYPPAAITALLTALARFEIEAADRERALADPRSIHVAQAALEREVARQAVLRRAFLLRDYSVVQEPLRHVADQLGIDLPEAGSEQARLLAYEATRVLLDASQEKVRRDQGGFCGPSPYFARAMAEETHPGMDAQTATTVSVEAPIEQDEAMKMFPLSWFTRRTTTITPPAGPVEPDEASFQPASSKEEDLHELLRSRGVLQSCTPEILAILEKRGAMTVHEGFTVYLALKGAGFGEEWQKHQKPDVAVGEAWARSSLPGLTTASKFWGQEMGSCEIFKVSSEMIEATIELIRETIARHGKGPKNTAATYRALAARVEAREAVAMDLAERALRRQGCTNEAMIRDPRLAEMEPRIRVETFLKHVRSANRVGSMLKGLGVIDDNPFNICTFSSREEEALKKTEQNIAQEPWDDRLDELLATPVFQGKAEDEADPLFWMPLMALLMGFRSEEAAQIGPMDVQSDQGITYVIVRQGLGDMDLSRDCAAPLTTYRVAKENTDGITTDRGIPRRSSACSVDERLAA